MAPLPRRQLLSALLDLPPSSRAFLRYDAASSLPILQASSSSTRPSIGSATSTPLERPSNRCFTSTTHHNNPSTVDPAEISHFNALASTWWDPHGPSRLLHLMNPLRHTFISRCLASSASASSLPQAPAPTPTHKLHYLDIGCGAGIFAESAARLPSTASITALDPSPTLLAAARAHAKRDPGLLPPGRKLTYLHTTIEDLPSSLRASAPAHFDVVTLFEVLEHVSTPAAFLEHVLPYVRPGGWLVLSTIARTWASWVTTKVVAEDVLRVVPRGTHDWEKYINEHELREWFAKRPGWTSPRCMGVVYVPGVGWREVAGSERVGNYFFGIRREPESG